MLDSFDTLVAFGLIMLVVSLLITIVVHMCTALFNLRGVNLRGGFGSTFAVIDPRLEDKRKELAPELRLLQFERHETQEGPTLICPTIHSLK